MLIELTRKLPVMNKLWDALSMHSCMVILICLKLLPLSWLSVTSTSYAISKLGIANGNLEAGARIRDPPLFQTEAGARIHDLPPFQTGLPHDSVKDEAKVKDPYSLTTTNVQ